MTAPVLLAPSLYPTLAEIFQSASGAPCPECKARPDADCDDSGGLHSIRMAAARQAGLISRGEFGRLLAASPRPFGRGVVIPWPVTA